MALYCQGTSSPAICSHSHHHMCIARSLSMTWFSSTLLYPAEDVKAGVRSCKLACVGQWWSSPLSLPLLLHHILCAAQERGLPLHRPHPPAPGYWLRFQLPASSVLLSSTGQDGQSHNGVRRNTENHLCSNIQCLNTKRAASCRRSSEPSVPLEPSNLSPVLHTCTHSEPGTLLCPQALLHG